ncbi:LOW QUALITY PROTEIN: potassium channel, subfamily K, member 16-like [Strix aluco]|uniref:LOW QUALITY PROTEIN: potassium channel, subfamily K, member 16-like n=1 Tax=Strix aluco TaxID=111821 RepID=UPI003DA5775A
MYLTAHCPCLHRIPVETGDGRALPTWRRLPRSVRDLPIATFHSIPCPVLPKAMCSGKLQMGLLVAGYFVYLLVGAAVFQALERTAEKQEKIAAAQMKEAFLQNFTHLTVVEMKQFMKDLTEAIQNGVYPVGNESQIEDSNWDFSNSFFFAGTVVSTIGRVKLRPHSHYTLGTAAPLICECDMSQEPQWCPSIVAERKPQAEVVHLSPVAEKQKTHPLVEEEEHHFNSKDNNNSTEFINQTEWDSEKFSFLNVIAEKKVKFLTLLFFLATGILVFLCLPSLFFQITEGWSYSKGTYFTLSPCKRSGNCGVRKDNFRSVSLHMVTAMVQISREPRNFLGAVAGHRPSERHR